MTTSRARAFAGALALTAAILVSFGLAGMLARALAAADALATCGAGLALLGGAALILSRRGRA